MDGSLLSNESSWNCSHAVSVRPGPGIPDLRIDQTGFTWPRRDPTWTAVVKSDLMRSKMTFQCLKMSEKTNDRGDTVKCKSPGANNSYFKSFLIKYIFKRIYCFFTVCSFRNKIYDDCSMFAYRRCQTVRTPDCHVWFVPNDYSYFDTFYTLLETLLKPETVYFDGLGS